MSRLLSFERRTLPWFVVVILLFAAATGCGDSGVEGSRPIDAAELASRLESGDAPLILDVRTPEEFDSGHIPGAVNIPHTELSGRLGELGVDSSEEIVVHCRKGGRADAAEVILIEAGYSDVRDLSGHMEGWQAAGHPVE